MAKTVTLALTEEEAKFLFGALDRVPLQGIGAARLVTAIAEKIATASRFAGERAPEAVRAGVEQALLSRITPAPRPPATVEHAGPNGNGGLNGQAKGE